MIAAVALALLTTSSSVAQQAGPDDLTHAENLYKAGKYKESVALLDVYLKAYPKDATALTDRGDDYQREANGGDERSDGRRLPSPEWPQAHVLEKHSVPRHRLYSSAQASPRRRRASQRPHGRVQSR